MTFGVVVVLNFEGPEIMKHKIRLRGIRFTTLFKFGSDYFLLFKIACNNTIQR